MHNWILDLNDLLTSPHPPSCGQITAEICKWISFIGLYGGSIAIVMSVLTITPETANCNPADTFIPPPPAM
jgi:hypothetical protein